MNSRIVRLLKLGKIGVLPTDTIYGIVGSALNQKTVEEIYSLRKRTLDKPMIVLISKIKDLEKFDIKLTQVQKDFLRKFWPNPLSVVLPCASPEFTYLHRGKKRLAFRMPKMKALLEMLKETGPLVAPSANFEGGKPSETIEEAKKYFGSRVSFYVNKGKIKAKPSTLLKINNTGKLTILREGSFQLAILVKFQQHADGRTSFKG